MDNEEGDVQQQFLEAFKELLELQNYRMSNMNDVMTQYCPQYIFPLILPTQIPNTFVVNLGPFFNQVQAPQVFPQGQQYQMPTFPVKEEETEKK